MEKANYFNDCSVLPTRLSVINKTLIKKISKHFYFIRVLGTGAYGVTIELNDGKGKQLAVKIAVTSLDSYDEIQTACKINSLILFSPIFTETYGWIKSYGVPDDWKERLRKEDYNDNDDLVDAIQNNYGLLFIAMEFHLYRFTEIMFTFTDLSQILFLLLHGIGEARKKFPFFRHADIHKDNVMIKINKDTQPIKLSGYILENVKYIPKLIDYGETRLSEKRNEDDFNPEGSKGSFFDDDGNKYPSRNDIYRIRLIVRTQLRYISLS
jgi:hypothetical protein